LSLSFVCGWLTIKSSSVMPAAVAHWLMNVFGTTPLGSSFQGIAVVTVALWAGMAILLFYFSPASASSSQ
jgi:membrane protease YdiL (CAAX protease family)